MSDKEPKGENRRTASSRRRKASRPPTLDLEAVEVEGGSDQSQPDSNQTEDTKAADHTAKGSQASAAGTSSGAKAGDQKAGGRKADPGKADPGKADDRAAATSAAGKAGKSGGTHAQGPSGGGGGQGRQDHDREKPDGSGWARTSRQRPAAGMGQLTIAAGGGAIICLLAFVTFLLLIRPDNNSRLVNGLGQLNDKIGALETRLGAASRESQSDAETRLQEASARAQAAQETVAALQKRIDTLENRLSADQANGGGASGEVTSARVRQLESRLEDLGPQVSQALSGLSDLRTGLKSVTEANGDGEAKASQVRLETLSERADRVEAELRQLAKNVAGVRAGDADVRRRLEQLAKAAEAENSGNQETANALARLDKQVDTVASRLDEVETIAREASTTDLSAWRENEQAQAQTIERLTRRLARAEAALPAVARFSLRQLEATAANGAPFTDELGTLMALLPSLQVDQQLEQIAAEGLTTNAALQARFRDVSNRIRAVSENNDAGLVSRLIEGASAVVTVRRGEETVVGSARTRAIDRIMSALEAGNLEAARERAGALSPKARDIAAGWLESLEQRLAADKALQELRNQTEIRIAAIGGASAKARN